jgi:hypothetical protein
MGMKGFIGKHYIHPIPFFGEGNHLSLVETPEAINKLIQEV